MTTTMRSNKPTEYELRDRVMEGFSGLNGIAYSGDTFRRYENGIWPEVHDLEIQREVSRMLEAEPLIEPSYRLETNVTNAIKSRAFVRADQWNANENILVFRNCSLELPGARRIEHNPEHYATVAIPYDYDPQAKAPTWLKVIGELLSEDEARFFQEFAGYCLTHSVEHQMTLWLVGAPGGGRSTLIGGLEAMLGGMAGTLGLADLQGSGSRFALSGIVGKTLMTCTENPKDHIKATDKLNALITGDTLTVERKYEHSFPYRNSAKLVWAINTLPGLHDPNNGLFRRVHILEMGSIPEGKRDPSIIDRVRSEGPGIVNWALDGLARLQERGRFEYPASVLAATERFKQSNDLPGQFILDCCEREPSESVFHDNRYKEYAQKLTDAFNKWAKANGHNARSTASLASEWLRLGLKKGNRDSKGQPYYGVKITDVPSM